jgi:DNA-binding winged helix-turn-helix (wHTH) protein
MRIAIIGGNPDDERHLERLAEKAGHAVAFVRARASTTPPPGAATAGTEVGSSAPAPGVVEHVLARLEREAAEEPLPGQQATPHRPQALVFDPGPRPDAAARVVAAVRRDPSFDRFGTVLVLQAEHIGAAALPGGFDDFVLFPCGVAELTVRVRALAVRRAALGRGRLSDDTGVLVDEASRDVIVNGRAVQLTAREFALFTYLCEWRGRVLSREHLLARVWGSRYSGGRRTVDIHVRRLRAKLGASLSIETLRGSGYRLRSEPTHSDAAPESTEYRTDSAPFEAQMPEPFSKVS